MSKSQNLGAETNMFNGDQDGKFKSFSELPPKLSLSSVVREGLIHMSRRSLDSRGKEVAGVSYIDVAGQTKWVDIPTHTQGDSNNVVIGVIDLAAAMGGGKVDEIKTALTGIELGRKLDYPSLILLPDSPLPGGIQLGKSAILVRGKRVTADFHFHPSGKATSSGDFSRSVYSDYPGKGVVANDQLFLLMKTKDTLVPSCDHDQFEAEIIAELDRYASERGSSEADARIPFLMSKCLEMRVAMYTGKIGDDLQRLV